MIDPNSIIRKYLDYPKLKKPPYRVLLLDSGYLTLQECRRGLERLGHRVFTIAPGNDFIARLLNIMIEARPDFLMAVNHLGFDEEGKLTALLTELGIPFASWYVDSPTYILYGGERNLSPYCAVFCWERSYLKPVEAMGFRSPRFLPLATDPEIFHPGEGAAAPRFSAPLSFVGESMEHNRRKWEKRLPGRVAREIDMVSCEPLLEKRKGELRMLYPTIFGHDPGGCSRLDMEAAIIWRTTQDYRVRLAKALVPLGLIVYGDPGWKRLLGKKGNLRGKVDYVRELPQVYRGTKVNINCTSFQMRTAVNQRVFDVPAGGGFLLTDRQEDMESFFEPGREAVCFHSIEEAVSLAAHYLGNETERKRIAEAARRRILTEHTYEKRMAELVAGMEEMFA